jgi:pimeloyl-ACP methyl ester carboxylesterase
VSLPDAADEPRYVDARDGTRLAVHVRGGGSPLLCVPGGPGRAAAYLEDLGGLDRAHRLLLLDNRGSGASQLPADRASLAFPRLADDVEDVRGSLGLDPVDVLAHSAGTAVSLLHAARHPERVRSLVVVTPSGRAFGIEPDDLAELRRRRAGEPWYADAAEAADLLEGADARLRGELERAMRPFWYGRWDARTQAHAAGADEQVSLRAAAGYAPGPDYDVDAARRALGDIRARVLVVVGELDALTGVSVGTALAGLVPDASVATIAGAGHFPWVDQPEAFAETVRDFLAA